MTIAIACQQKSKQSALIFCLLFLCLSSIYEKTYASPVQLSGWHSTWLTSGTSVPTKHALAYKPSSLREGKTFKIIIWAPEITNTENLDSWLVSRASAIQKSLGQPKKKWRVKSEKSGARSLNNSFKNSSGVNFQVGYQADWTDNGEAYVGQLIASNHLAMMLKYGVKIETVIDHALRVFSSDDYQNRLALSQSKENDASNSSSVQVASTDQSSQSSNIDIQPGAAPKGLQEIRGVQVFGMQPGGLFGLTEEFIATFNDGTYTTDFALTFNVGVAESKARKPDSWGRWRERNGKLELMEKRDQEFDTTSGNWIVDRGFAGESLSQCFSRLSSAGGDGPLVGGSRSWCFTSDGRFANSSMVYTIANTSAGGVNSASASPEIGGRYLIDGYTIRFAFDDGRQETAAFAFASEKKHHIVINGRRYIGKEP